MNDTATTIGIIAIVLNAANLIVIAAMNRKRG